MKTKTVYMIVAKYSELHDRRRVKIEPLWDEPVFSEKKFAELRRVILNKEHYELYGERNFYTLHKLKMVI